MQFDKTAIVIAQRSTIELLDISFKVFRRYWLSILLFAAMGVIPFATFNFFVLWPLNQYDRLLMETRQFGDAGLYHFRYLFIMTALILLEAPMALCAVTYFVGQAVFIQRPSIRQVFHAVWSRTAGVVVILGLLRMSLLALIPAIFLYEEPVFRPEIEIPLYGLCLCGLVYFVRSFRPFAAEILLLERCPLFSNKARPEVLSYHRRSHWLHSSLSGELFATHIIVTIIEFLLCTSLSLGVLFSIGVLTGFWNWGPWMDLFFYPLCVWAVVTWATVFRFLTYMNSRIQIEGWEIELRLRAEAQRLEGATA